MTGRGSTFVVFDRSGNAVQATNLLDPGGTPIINPRTGSPYISPVDYSVVDAINYGHRLQNHSSGIQHVLREIANDFRAGGSQDLQRSYNGNTGGGGAEFVEEFRDIASFHFGLASSAAGLNDDTAVAGGGIYNGIKDLLGANIDSSGEWWNNPRNVPNIREGYAFYQSGRHGIERLDPNNLTREQIDAVLNGLLENDLDVTRWFVDNLTGRYCFLSGTAVEMWPTDPSIQPDADGTYNEELVRSRVWTKAIEDVREGDVVLSYDDAGNLKPGRVKRTFQNEVTHVLDFWGTGVTPGHAYLCGDGQHEGQHLPIIDILRQDGAIVRDDGTLVRASTNCQVGSIGDRLIHASAGRPSQNGSKPVLKASKVRFGTRVILPDGRHASFMEMARGQGWGLSDDGYMVAMMRTADGLKQQKFMFPWAYGDELPKPEDYILRCSDVTLSEIYAAGEWEQIGTQMAPPADMENARPGSLGIMLESSKPAPNVPPAFLDHPDAPLATAKLSHDQRRAAEARRQQSSGSKARQLH